MHVRFCVESDLPAVLEIFESQNIMYGVDITEHKPAMLDRLKILVLTPSKRQCLVGAFEGDQLVGFVGMLLFRDFPFWRASLLFFNRQLSALPAGMTAVGGALFDFIVKYAESMNVFEFFYVVRDSGRKRFAMSLESAPYVSARYDIVDLRVIQPGEVPQMQFYKDLLGAICGLNTKRVVIRQGFLKPEHRRSPW